MRPVRFILILVFSVMAFPVLLRAKQISVTISNQQFSPSSIEVQPGDTVIWINSDDRDHTVVGGGFKSGNLKPGASFSFQFTKAGRFSYGSSIYPRMKGTVTVKEK